MPERRHRPRSRAAPLAVLATGIALWPYTGVIQGRAWAAWILVLALVLVLTGALLRRAMARMPDWARDSLAALAQLLLLVCLLTWLFGRSTALLGVLPTPDTAELLPFLISESLETIWFGYPPLAATGPLLFLVTAAFGLLAILLDHLLAHRLVVLASAAVALVGAVPIIATAGDVDLWWFLAFAVTMLLLLRHDVRREAQAPRPSPRFLAALVGAGAIAGTAFLGPSMPLTATGTGQGARVTLNATLDLGADLRKPERIDVITLATSAHRAPYLRLTTLSEFDGDVWHPDQGTTTSIAQGFGPLTAPEDLPSQSTSIRMQDVAGQWLPVPYPAVEVFGLDDSWRAMLENRTVVSATSSARDQDYTVTSLHLEPTREEMRADRAGGDAPADTRTLPADVPAHLAALAQEVTADAANDYDRLIALQSWFRSGFRYSLSAPVEQGFDGSGAEAIGRFLEVRSGYCVHFASAFTLMARSLGMPARVVVGFLPGTPTGERRGEEMLYAVSNEQLHAWPEVYFERWGWVPFEPTASLGNPTNFPTSAERETPEDVTPTTTPSEPPTTASPLDPELLDPETGPAEIPQEAASFDPRPLALTLIAIVLLALLPAMLRLARRGTRMARASRGDAGAAWAELEDTAVDLGIAVSDTETPRERGARLQAHAGARGTEMGALVSAIEQASYAPAGSQARRVHVPLRRAIRQLMNEASPQARRRALLLPRSLLRRRR